MKLGILIAFVIATVGCAKSAGTSESASLADFSSLYKTWYLPNAHSIEWKAGATTTSSVMTHPTDDYDGVNYCDCDVYGYGGSTAGQVRTTACTYRGNPSLSASKCTWATRLSDFNFTLNSFSQMVACFKETNNYQTCETLVF